MGSAQSRLFYKRKHEQRGLQHPPVLSARPPTADLNPPLGLKWVDGNGLTKAAPSAYVLSHDMEEANRLNQQHYLVNFVFGSNHMTPLQEQLWQGARVLDGLV
ncbi:hypothetical protein BC938DRAFT_471986 [Jimgerdemannia flammicorona]|uniref:Uncharacterized protein n=1 Tax=Jimgerdemannia flammicorona TaxID=994334 RepID=A0A433QUA1_9FUNG|nr:hypothetical protein BC938DRAFT_471986 [Jimgerdemannia flammicorona]